MVRQQQGFELVLWVRDGTGRVIAGTYLFPIWLSLANGVIEDASYDANLVDGSANEWSVAAVKNNINAFDPDMVVIESNIASYDKESVRAWL